MAQGGLGDAIIAELERRGITQRDAAALLATSQQTLSKWVNGVHAPSEEAIGRLAAFLDVSDADVRALLPRRSATRFSSSKRLDSLEARLDRMAMRQARDAERMDSIAARLDGLLAQVGRERVPPAPPG